MRRPSPHREPTAPKPLRAIALTLALLCLPGARGAAADSPGDVVPVDAPRGAPALPAAPPGFTHQVEGAVRWDYPARARDEVAPLVARLPESLARIEDELGVPFAGPLRVRVGRGADELRALAPEGAPPPRSALGVAYPALGLVLLTLTAPDTGRAPDLDRVLDHELSHVALHRAVGGRPLPRWFVEGVAVHQAREQNLTRIRALAEAVYGDHVIDLAHLSAAFPSRPHQVNVAYAQSADFIGFLLRGADGARRFRKLVARLRDGESLEDAVANTHRGASLRSLEREWRADLDERFRGWPIGLTGGFLGAVGLGLVLYGVLRRRRKAAPVLARWAEEEAAVDRLEAARAEAEAAAEPRPAARPPPIPPTGRASEPPHAGDGVPRVQVDGETHTLH